MDKDKFDKLIERADQESKDDFLRFVTGIYGVDECVFKHIFEIPIISRYDTDEIVTTSISTKTEDELYRIVNSAINGENMWIDGEDVAAYVNFDEIDYLNSYEKSELYDLIKYNAVIVYNDEFFKKAIDKDSNKLSEEELYNKYKGKMKKAFTHERVHVNNAYYDISLVKMTKEELDNERAIGFDENEEIFPYNENADVFPYSEEDYYEGMREEQQHSNGAETINDDTDNIYDYEDYWRDNNEVMVETIERMMANYEKGDTLIECLKKLIKERNGKTLYPGIDDSFILSIYALFPEELTEWMLFGAYDFTRQNKLQKIIKDVLGTDMPLKYSKLKKKVEEYATTLEEGTLSDDQIEILEMLGFSISRKIDKEDMKEVATSEKSLGALSGSLLDVKAFMQSMQKEDSIKGQ